MARWEWTSRDTPSDGLEISSITITPDPPTAGTTVKGTITATAHSEIVQGAVLHVNVRMGYISLIQQGYDLFEFLKDGFRHQFLTFDTSSIGESIKQGELRLPFVMNLPHDTPIGKMKITVQGRDRDGEPLFDLYFELALAE